VKNDDGSADPTGNVCCDVHLRAQRVCLHQQLPSLAVSLGTVLVASTPVSVRCDLLLGATVLTR
jgi:hypothetical protein